MATKLRSKPLPRILAAFIALCAAAGLVALLGAAPAAASTTSITQNFNCTMPLVGNQIQVVTLTADVPTTVTPGQPSTVTVTTQMTLSTNTSQIISLTNGATLQGTETTGLTITDQHAATQVPVTLTMATTAIPTDTSPVTASASGSATLPATFTPPATVAFSSFSAIFDPKTATGAETSLGTFQVNCAPGIQPPPPTSTIPQNTWTPTTGPSPTSTGPSPTTTWTPPPPQDDSATTVKYNCQLPLAPGLPQSLSVYYSTNVPTFAPLGQTYDWARVRGSIVLPASVTSALRQRGITEVGGQGQVNGTVVDEPSRQPLTVQLTSPTTPVPAIGQPLAINVTGILGSAITFPDPNIAWVNLDRTLSLSLVPPGGTGTIPALVCAPVTSPPAQPLVQVFVNGTVTSTGRPPSPNTLVFTANGDSQINGATVYGPVSSTVSIQVDPSGTSFTGTIDPINVNTSFTWFGFIPITAKIAMTPVGPVSGTVHNESNGSQGTLAVRENIGLTDLSLFGAPVIWHSTTCQASSPADVGLSSHTGFSLGMGGMVNGPFTIPPFSGCGLFDNFVSAAISGTNNGIAVILSPVAFVSSPAR
jgi:hypothetical protein